MYRQADTHTKDLTLGAILSTSPDIRLYPGKKEKQTLIYTVRRPLAGQEGPIPSADRRPPTHTHRPGNLPTRSTPTQRCPPNFGCCMTTQTTLPTRAPECIWPQTPPDSCDRSSAHVTQGETETTWGHASPKTQCPESQC